MTPTGAYISRAFLSEKDHFGTVKIFTRDATSHKASELEGLGAKLVTDPITAGGLAGVDVLVNALPLSGTTAEERDRYAKAAAEAGVRVYFPSDYGG